MVIWLLCEEGHARNGLSLAWLDCAKQRREAMINEYNIIETWYLQQSIGEFSLYAETLNAASISSIC